MDEPMPRFFHKSVVALLDSFPITFGEGTIFKSDSSFVSGFGCTGFFFQEGVTLGEGTILRSDSCSISAGWADTAFFFHEGVAVEEDEEGVGCNVADNAFSFFFQAGTNGSGCSTVAAVDSSLLVAVSLCRFCHAGTDAERGGGCSSDARLFHEGGVADRCLLSLVGSGKKDFFRVVEAAGEGMTTVAEGSSSAASPF